TPGKRTTSSPTTSCLQCLKAVFQSRFAGRARAMDAAENLPVCFNAVPDNPALTMGANRRQRMDRALEAVERVVLPANDHFKRLVIFIFANFACSHTQIFRTPRAWRRCLLDLRAVEEAGRFHYKYSLFG